MEAELSAIVGERLREARTARGLSLGALAGQATLGKGTLSEIENGLRNPNLSTLYALANALDLPLASLLGGTTGAEVSSPGIRTRLLDSTQDPGGSVEVYELLLEPGSTHESAPHGRGTAEHLYVTAGTVRAGIAGDEDIASSGGSLTWVSDAPHTYAAAGDEPARAVLVITRSP